LTPDVLTPASAGLGSLRTIPYMGVIYVVHEAMKLGFENGHPDWCNLGQGQPEVGEMEGAPPRVFAIEMEPGDHAYGPIGGTTELREAIAAHVNRLYRQGMASQYTADNVSVACGGRLMLSRFFAAMGDGRLGYQIPDYTAYADMIGYHQHRFTPVLVEAKEENGFIIPPADFARALEVKSLDTFVVSDPCNPTGRVLRGDDLAAYVSAARDKGCTLVLDEFYSHFNYAGDEPAAGPVSGAPFIEDVDRDPVLLIDGLTKSFRYPGWRVGWAVGPPEMVETLGRAASAIDGGPSMPVQRAALKVLEPARADQETTALRTVFVRKKNQMVERLRAMGVRIPVDSEGTFYVWGTIKDLPAPLNDAETLFRRAHERKVLPVPGIFFDVNPGKLRQEPSPLVDWMRFSFGPPEDNMRLGLDRLEAMVAEARG
jgi:aspartate/methionine/tyrosine aminotransferase